jgi:hypothetical protein
MEFIQGHIDMCQQTIMSGWAVENKEPANVRIKLNGEMLAAPSPSIARLDIAAALELNDPVCGFTYQFRRGLTASDRLEIEIGQSDTLIDPLPHRHRVNCLTHGIDGKATGLEFGPLDRPFLDRDHFNVLYIDHDDTDGLRGKYSSANAAHAALVHQPQIAHIDIVWSPGRSLIECCGGRKFSYAIASQVLEHVANPIGWLNEVSACLKPGARINLTLPEMTRTFDHYRRLSTAADMIEAHERNYTRPHFRQVFDHIANVAVPPAEPDHSVKALQQALGVGRIADAGEYVDVHCYVWTHDSFRECWEVIEKIDLCRARLDQSWPAVALANEFMLSFVV